MPTTKSSVGWLARALACFGLALVAGHASPQTVTYFHNDAAGSPMVATDASGNVVWKESYRPYGERVSNPPAEAGNSIGFAGKPFDSVTGLSYAGARYYDPGIGRFVSSDAAPANPESVHGTNRYSYANENPYRFVDPDGHSALDIGFLIWDIGRLAGAIYRGADIREAATDVALSAVGVVIPIPGVGQALKGARAVSHAVDGTRAVGSAISAGAKTGSGTITSTAGVVREFEQVGDKTYYRVYSGNANVGSWVTALPPKSSAWAQEALSLPPANKAEFIQEVLVPHGTRLERSRAAKVPEWDRLRGGAEQFRLVDRIPTKNFGPGTPLP